MGDRRGVGLSGSCPPPVDSINCVWYDYVMTRREYTETELTYAVNRVLGGYATTEDCHAILMAYDRQRAVLQAVVDRAFNVKAVDLGGFMLTVEYHLNPNLH